MRTCVGCRVRAPVDDLLRVVAADGVLVPDPRRRLPGRGAWLHPAPECLTRAERRSAFPRALRVPGPLPADRVRSCVQAGNTPVGAPPAPPAAVPLGSAAGTTPEHHTEHHPSVIGARDPGADIQESKVDPS